MVLLQERDHYRREAELMAVALSMSSHCGILLVMNDSAVRRHVHSESFGHESPTLKRGLVIIGSLLRALWQSYFPARNLLSYGMRVNKCDMQFRRARFLSSDRTMYHGAASVSVASNIISRARE